MEKRGVKWPYSSGACTGDDTCPWCYHNVKSGADFWGHRGMRSKPKKKQVYGSWVMKSPKEKKATKGTAGNITDKKFLSLYPTIVMWMTDDKWDTGKDRELATLSVKFSSDEVLISFSDRNEDQTAYTSAETVEDALGLLEEALATDKVSWRRWKRPGKK